MRKGDTTPAGLGPAGPSPGTFLIIGCKCCILNTFFAEFVLISPPKFCVNFAFKAPIYVMRENFHLRFRGSNKAQEGIFVFSRRIVGGSGFPREFLINGLMDTNGAFLARVFFRLPDDFPQNCV